MWVHDSSVRKPDADAGARSWRMRISSPSPGRVEIHVEGVLDVAGARRITELLPPGRASGVFVDLSAVRQVEDRALALLAESLTRSASSVTIGGLGRHQQRLLRLLGREGLLEAPSGR